MQEPERSPTLDCRHSTIDTSRPFRSVKEAVAIFGERFLVGEIYNPKPFTLPQKETPLFSPSPLMIDKSPMWACATSSPSPMFLEKAVRKLEAELDEAKNELKLLKERELENKVALASLSAELHRNVVSKLAESVAVDVEEKRKDEFLRMENGSSRKLAQILSITEGEGLFGGKKKERKVRKKKPIVPLVGDFFGWRKGASSDVNSALYASSHLQWSI